uniref:Uncharacterized protein n=1 Tax=Solanum tuberosum TaxID=4113 RepID=M1AYL8_SOLTU
MIFISIPFFYFLSVYLCATTYNVAVKSILSSVYNMSLNFKKTKVWGFVGEETKAESQLICVFFWLLRKQQPPSQSMYSPRFQ